LWKIIVLRVKQQDEEKKENESEVYMHIFFHSSLFLVASVSLHCGCRSSKRMRAAPPGGGMGESESMFSVFGPFKKCEYDGEREREVRSFSRFHMVHRTVSTLELSKRAKNL
jgi:hypothetical protein